MKRLFGGIPGEETWIPVVLVVITALALQNLLLVLTLAQLSSPNVVVVFRALARVMVLVLVGPVTS